MSASNVVLYRYDASPFAAKIDNVLLLKNIPHRQVKISASLPRPEITQLLGLNYRRIPVLAIGSDIYCDTSLIASTLEHRFPSSKGYGTIFPPRKNGGNPDTGLLQAYAQSYPEAILFPLAPAFLAWDKFPSRFIEDRSGFFGSNVDPTAIIASRPRALSTLSSHLVLLEEQLKDGRDWLFDTTLPSLADVSTHFILNWLKGLPASGPIYDHERIPFTMKWLSRMNSHLDGLRKIAGKPEKITGDIAAKAIASGPFEPHDVVGFDAVEASRLHLKRGDTVAIAPNDTGRNYPTVGKLCALSRAEFVIEIRGEYGPLKCHFPRIGFFAKVVDASKL